MGSGAAHRVITAATAVMPPSRRDWGRALRAELDHVDSRAGQVRLVLAAFRVALMPPRALIEVLGAYGRVAGRSAVLTSIAFVPAGLGLYLMNVVFPAWHASVPATLAMVCYQIAILLAAGALAGRGPQKPATTVVAGVTAGLVLTVLGLGTLLAIEVGLGYTGAAAPAVTLILAAIGAMLAPIGAALATEATEAWSRMRHLKIPRSSSLKERV